MSNQKSRALKPLTLSYAALMVIALLLAMLAIIITSRMMWEELYTSNNRNLNTGMLLMEDAFNAAHDFMNDTMQNAELKEFLSPSSERNAYTFRSIADNLPTLHTANGIIDRYFVYYNGESSQDQDFVLGPHTPYTKLSYYYHSCFRFEDLSEEEFWEMIRGVRKRVIYPSTDTVYLSQPTRSLLMVQPYNNQKKIFFMVYFNEERIIQLFNSMLGPSTNWVGIYNSDGEHLISHYKESLNTALPAIVDLVGSEGYLKLEHGYVLQYVRDRFSGRVYAAVFPSHYFARQIAQTLSFVYFCVFALVLLTMLVMWRLTQNSHKPLKQIISLLPINSETTEPGLWPIKTTVEALLKDHSELNNQLQIRNTQLRDAAISQLIKGSFENEDALDDLLLHTGLVIIPSEEYRGIYLRLLTNGESSEVSLPHLSLRHLVLSEALATFAPDVQILTLKNENEYILLYTRLKDSLPMTEIMSHLYSILKNVWGADISLFVGIPCKNLRMLHQSFTSAKFLSRDDTDREKFLSIAEARPMNKSFDYTPQDESALLVAARRNDMEKIDEILNSIYDRNFIKQTLTFFMQQSLYNAMIHTLSRTECPEPLPNELMNIPIRLVEKEFFEVIKHQYVSISMWLANNRRRDSNLMLDNVVDFIQENYTIPDMSLTYTALHFGLTEQYLSEAFKKRTGNNFSTYLEQLRIKKAQELLQTTELTVQQITEYVGYANIRTFRRAFSRVLGHPPSEERQS